MSLRAKASFRLPRKVLRMRKPAMPRRNKLPQQRRTQRCGRPAECLLPPRCFGRYTAVSPTDVVLTAFPDLLPGDADGVEKLRKEFKTLGGKSAEKMTSSERTRYAALAHVLTLYRY